MLLRIPSYYKEFHCIADKCKNSCCIGWGIDIDEDTRAYYLGVEGALGERLRKHLEMDEEGIWGFRLRENGWCPFLNERKLCDICIELGEEALSEVCTEYPRFTMEYGNVREKCLCLSCEEVGRILFSTEKPVTWEEMEIPETGDIEEEADLAREVCLGTRLEQVRDRAVGLLQNRENPISLRIADYLSYCEKMQHEIFGGTGENEAAGDRNHYQAFLERMECLKELEPLEEGWVALQEELLSFYRQDNYETLHAAFCQENGAWEYTYEHLLVYFTFRYFMRAVYDDNLLAKAKFAVAAVMVIRDMDVWRYHKNGGQFTLEDRIDTARIYAKEVEHSEENVALLLEDMQFEDIFQVNRLIWQASIL
ncbi:MAG: flagellin lysine-N-methylase [Roseburia sp.]